jgi:hypothetical protein
VRSVTIRAKLYAAIVLTVLGPLATTGVALHGMAQMGDRFDEVRARTDDESIARELKFAVTDMNGWQTAYGYDGGRSRPQFVRSAATLRQDLELATERLRDPREQALLSTLEEEFVEFMKLDAIAWRELRAGREQRTKQILLGPEIGRFRAMAGTAEQLATYETERAEAAAAEFDDARDDARRRLIAVGLGAGVVIILLLVAANDVARLALEGERRSRTRASVERPGEEGPS